ncbi:AEC family transporter [Pararhizobium haloflavum]|uniref:AEC family transporter n=1 Tax=Pararhizobium haloflavum TaxID=2037914 RepID=UPI000C1745CD|nr:AEC family transporter [Pararhizobium haloflavum]
MLDLFSITAPIFLLIGVGFVAVLSGIVAKHQAQALAVFVLNFALPALIIDALSTKPFDQLFDARYLAAYAIGSLLVFGAMFLVMRYAVGRSLSHAAIAALGSSGSNSGFIGYPVAVLVIGELAAVGLALNMMIENMVIIPLALALAESGLQSGQSLATILRATGRRLVRNPIIIAIVIGMALSLSGVTLPGPVDTAIGMMATASAPAALFVIGAALVGLRLGSMALDVGLIVAAKLIAHPLAVAFGFMLLPGVDPDLVVAAVIFAGVPMLSVYPIFGQRFGMEGVCAAALMVATLAAFFTTTMLLGIVSGN